MNKNNNLFNLTDTHHSQISKIVANGINVQQQIHQILISLMKKLKQCSKTTHLNI